jgi:glycosyltransferase involved in cell wall biosynthesis
MTSEQIAVSLVVCTRNRACFLPEFLRSLDRLQFQGTWEIVIVDNGSTDATSDCLSAFCQAAPAQRRLVVEPVPGLARARNAGVRLARGDVICFTDDDCYPRQDYIEQIALAFENPAIGFVAGRVLLHDPEDLPITILLKTEKMEYPADRFIRPGELLGANFSFRREALEQCRLFDANLGAGTPFPCEDCDALLRVSEAGWQGTYEPEAVVWHHHRRQNPGDLAKLERTYVAGRGAFYMKFLIRSRHPLRIARNWFRSGRYFGWRIWLSELYWGLKYLVTTRARHGT